MLKFLTRALAALAVLFTPAAYAQTVTDADPAIWVVRDEDTTIYLFGTIHALKPGLSWFDEAVKDAFDKSDEVMLEVDMSNPGAILPVMMRLSANDGGATITQLLPEDKRGPYASALGTVGLPPAMFENKDPWYPAIMLTGMSLSKFGYDPNQGAETIITAAAKAANKPIGGLETAEEQLGYFDGLPLSVQVTFLVQTVDELPRMGATLDGMLAQWSSGDPDGLGKTMNDNMASTPEIADALLYRRNERWAQWIAERMKRPGTVFIAVGAGHLAGPKSVQFYLDKHQLKAERIPY